MKTYRNNILSVLRLAVLTAAWVFIALHSFAQIPTNQDCLGAIPICSNTYTVSFNHNGMGNFPSEIFNVSSCYAPEQRSVWLKFTVQQAGLLRYSITPLNANQDHDWTLFDMTSTSCAQLATSVGASGAMARSNTWGVFGANGPTGVSTPNGGFGICNGPGNLNGPQWNADLPVAAGSSYYLHITNWTGTVYGFTIDFSSSTAVLFDNTPPAMDTITSSTSCQSFDSLVIQFDEPLLCSSVQSGDFSLSGPGGPYTVTSASSLNCTNGFSNEIVVHFSPAANAIGNYTLGIIPGAGYVEDACGNLDTLDSVSFSISQLIETEMIATNLDCFNECNGQIQLNVTGGALPLTFNWSNGLPSGTNQTQLCAGLYSVSVLDDAGCEVIDTITVEQPDDIVQSVLSSTNLSCPNSTGCDGTATVSAAGGTFPYYYSWLSGTAGPTAFNLCSGFNTVITTDVNGCVDSFDVSIGVPNTISTISAGDTLICIGEIASMAAASSGGTPPFSYTWFEDSLLTNVLSQSQTPQVSIATTTSFWVRATDANGCPGDTAKVVVRIRPPLGLDLPKIDTICPYDTINIAVSGTGGDSIYTFSWSTGVFGPSIKVSPDLPTWYRVTVSDFCGTPAYEDSVYVQVGGYSAIKSEISFEDDSVCAGRSLYLIASGRGGFNGSKEYQYRWSHTNDTKPIQFVKPSANATYRVTISDLCLSRPDTSIKTIYVGNPEHPKLEALPNIACEEAEVHIRNTSFNLTSKYTWTFSDGSVLSNFYTDSALLAFDETGCFDARVDVQTEFGCYSSTEFPCLIQILEQPRAEFSADPINPTNVHPDVTLTNRSLNESSFTWYIGNNTISNKDQVYKLFDEYSMDSTVTLVAISEEGCVDSVTKSFQFLYETLLYYPNSFSPNEDGLNDVFKITGEAIQIEDFHIQIFNRWGKLMFESKDISKGWDGKMQDGRYITAGAYPFALEYRNNLAQLKTIRDQIIVSNTGKKVGLR
ncbi:gliding motility-associated C-terminal domain-containing protein [Salibacteraceae bacterium]|nr:gliding motility-associated C-terminal domain-containing protein [Salibacteraceae bacterium]